MPLHPREVERLREAGLLDEKALRRAVEGGDSRRPRRRGQGTEGDARRTPRRTAGGDEPGRTPRRGQGAGGDDRRTPRRAAAGEEPGRTPHRGQGAGAPPSRKKARGKAARTQELGPQRLQKVLAHAGVASRRAAEQLILAGRVRVNGEVVTTLGTKADPAVDQIEVDGQPLGSRQPLVYCLLNKPRRVVTTVYDPQGRRTVLDLIPDAPVRLFPVGRLDYDTEGLLLLTNDGELAHSLLHPARQVAKTYLVRVRGIPSRAKLERLEKGVDLEDGRTAPCQVQLLKVRNDPQQPANQTALVEMTLHEGRNRQVRRMMAAVGHEVISLRRTRLGPLTLRGLQPGQYRYLTLREVKSLRQKAGLHPEPPRPLAEVPRGAQGSPEERPALRRGTGEAAAQRFRPAVGRTLGRR